MGAAAAVKGREESTSALAGSDHGQDVGALARAHGRGGASAADDGENTRAVAGRIAALLFLGMAGEGRGAAAYDGDGKANGEAMAVQEVFVCAEALVGQCKAASARAALLYL